MINSNQIMDRKKATHNDHSNSEVRSELIVSPGKARAQSVLVDGPPVYKVRSFVEGPSSLFWDPEVGFKVLFDSVRPFAKRRQVA